jgi:hypothetical protein
MNADLPASISAEIPSEELFKYFDKAFKSFHEAVNLIQWEKFGSKLRDFHFVPLTLISSITECALCLGKMQELQPSIPLYAVLRSLMESSYKFRYLIADPSKLQLHALQLQYGSIYEEEKANKLWSKTQHTNIILAQQKNQELIERKIELERKFKIMGETPCSKSFTDIIDFLSNGHPEEIAELKAEWSASTGMAHGQLDALQRYTFRQYVPTNLSASVVRNTTDQYLIYSASTEYLHHAAVAATELFNRSDWYQQGSMLD